MNNFYDTSALIELRDNIEGKFYISSLTFKELRKIKNSSRNYSDKTVAEKLLNFLTANRHRYEIIPHKTSHEEILETKGFEITDDLKVVSDALSIYDKCVFVTYKPDIYKFASSFSSLNCKFLEAEKDNYKGFIEVAANDERLAILYEEPKNNIFNLLIGQYLIVKDAEKTKDIKCWTGEYYRPIERITFSSDALGDVKPYQNDPYQRCAFDALVNNKLIQLRGGAGVGKSSTSLAYLFHLLESERISKIIMISNPLATNNAAKLGFYSGGRVEKLLDCQVGNFLKSQLGGIEFIQDLIDKDKLLLLPASDIRGFNTSGMNAAIYVTEAQNLDRELIKLILQRVGEDCICVIEGDNNTQLDDVHFEGINNGMRRMSEVFRGQPYYGEIELQNCYRSQTAKRAELI